MLVLKFLKQFIKYGILILIDSRGKSFTFVGTPAPKITICLHSKSIEHRLFLTPMLALGEGYMDGNITLKKETFISCSFFVLRMTTALRGF